MNKLSRLGLLTAVFLFILLSTLLLSFPFWGRRLPTQAKLYLPDPMLAQITTPLPTALPAPELFVEATIPPLILPRATAVSTATAQPTDTAVNNLPKSVQVSPTPSPTPTNTPLPLPQTVRLDNLQILPQKFNNCGPANLTIILNYYGVDSNQLDIAASIRPYYDDRNVSPWEMVKYVNENSPLKAKTFVGGDLDTLKQLLAAGFPVIIEKGLLPEGEDWMGHYLTLIGYDEPQQTFLALDTFLGPWDSSGLRESYDFIEEYWQQFNNRFVIIYPPEQEAVVAAIVGDIFSDPLLMWQKTAVQAQEVTRKTPENAFAWFNLGSSLTHLAQLTNDPSYAGNAAIAFDKARNIGLPWRMLWYQFEPYQAYLLNGRNEEVITLANAILQNGGGLFVEETYLYKGLALQQLGEEEAATAVFKRGLELNPTHAQLLAANNN